MTEKVSLPLLKGLVVGEYGKSHTVTLKDFDGDAQDVSSYTGITVKLRSPDSKVTITSTGSWTTDGSDGKVSWAFSSGSLLTRPGIWDGQVGLTKTGYVSRSYPFSVEVEKEIG